MAEIRFGTDGWRAVIGEDFTFDNVRAVAQATAAWMQRAGLAASGAVVGYDTRFLSAEFAQAVAEVLAATASPSGLRRRPLRHPPSRTPCGIEGPGRAWSSPPATTPRSGTASR